MTDKATTETASWGYVHTSIEVRDMVIAVLEPLRAEHQGLAFGHDNTHAARVDRAFHVGAATGVALALNALAEVFGFESPAGPVRPELADEDDDEDDEDEPQDSAERQAG